jgi:hypothetical protein
LNSWGVYGFIEIKNDRTPWLRASGQVDVVLTLDRELVVFNKLLDFALG